MSSDEGLGLERPELGTAVLGGLAPRRLRRSRGFPRLDHDLMEQEARIVPLGAATTLALVSPRLSCVSFNSVIDINVTGLCLRG